MITCQQKDILNQFYESSKYLMRDTENTLKQITGLKRKELYVSTLFSSICLKKSILHTTFHF